MSTLPVPRHGYRMLRRGRHSEAGRAYLLTAVCAARAPLFADHELARPVARIIATSSTWPASAVLAWVLMPDHLHVLLQLDQGGNVSRAMQRMKSLTSRAVRARVPLSGPPWQPGFHDRALRRDEDLRAVARYVVANPLRAGLVEQIGDYPYWNAVWL